MGMARAARRGAVMTTLRENLKWMTAGKGNLFEKDIISTEEEEKEKEKRRGRNGGGGVDVRGYLPVIHPDQAAYPTIVPQINKTAK